MLEGTPSENQSVEPAIADNIKLQGLSRTAALLTEAELYNMVC